MERLNKKNKSFTLIEILVVIVVIGILSSFILVGMSSISQKANFAKGQAFFNSIDNSLLLGRVSLWKLDQVSGTNPATTIDAWNSNTGTFHDGVSTACVFSSGSTVCPQLIISGECPSGNCLSFDGVNDYVNYGSGSNLSITNYITICGWIKSYDVSSRRDILTKGNADYLLSVYGHVGTGMLAFRFNIGGSYYGPQGNINDVQINTWNYIVGTYNGSIANTYSNGVIKSSIDVTGNISTSVSDLNLGLYSTYYFGLIDDVRIYDQALSSSQIQQNYYIGINKLFKNSGIALDDFNQRLSEFKFSLGEK